MREKVVGFFTELATQFWFSEFGHQVRVIDEKRKAPQGNGFPHVIMKMRIPDDKILERIHPHGMLMDKDFDEC